MLVLMTSELFFSKDFDWFFSCCRRCLLPAIILSIFWGILLFCEMNQSLSILILADAMRTIGPLQDRATTYPERENIIVLATEARS